MKKKILSLILALVAIATTARAQTKYDIWVGGVQVTSANASNVTGGDITGGTVKYDATENELILRNVTITRSGKSKQGIRNQVAGLTITFFGTNTITTDNSCALRCDANTYLWMMPNSKITFTEKQQEAFYVTGGKSLFITGSHLTELYVNSTNEYAVEGEKGTETVTFQGGPVVTLNGKKGSLVKLGKVVFTESQNKSTSVTLKATNNSSYPQVQNVAAWEEEGYNHIDAPIGLTSTHPVYKSSEKTVLVPWGHLKGNITSHDIVINEDVVPLNSTTFPDANFLTKVKKLCSNYNQNGYLNRGFISKAMAKAVTEMYLYMDIISNLKGIEHFTELTSLECGGNFLTSLDVSKNAALTKLRCNWNELTSLNVSGCTALTELICSQNQLTALDVSKNTALTTLWCYGNKINKTNMQTLVNNLPPVSGGKFYVINTKDSKEENVITKPQVNIANGKGWKVYDYNGGSSIQYAGSDETPTSIDNGQLIIDNLDGDWYSIDGKKLKGEPTKKGVYIVNGKKVVK